MNIADILTEYGEFYLGANNQENRSRLFNKLYQPSETAALFTEVLTDATKWRAARSYMTQVLQAWKKTFSPTDPLTMEPKTIDLQKIKIDVQETPDDLEESWLGFLARLDRAGNLDRTQWPFVRWYIEEHLIPRAHEQHELSEIFWGIYTAPPVGATPGAEGETMDGLNKKIEDYKTATIIDPITTGAPNTDDVLFLGELEDFVKTARGLLPQYANRPMELMIEYSNYLKALRGYRNKYGTHTDFNGANNSLIIDSNVTIVGSTAMSSDPANPGTKSNKYILSHRENRLRLLKLKRNMETIQVESHSPRVVDFYTDWYEAVDFLMPDLVFVNDQA